MSPIIRIALRRIRKNKSESFLFVISVLFTMLLISFFTFFELQGLSAQNSLYLELPIDSFIYRVRLCMRITSVVLIIITFLSLRIYCGLRSEKNTHTLAVLTSVGAARRHKFVMISMDLLIMYIPSAVLGILSGAMLGIRTFKYAQADIEHINVEDYVIYSVAAMLLLVFGIVLLLTCNLLPEIRFKRFSVIEKVKKQNVKASEQRHGYRQSETFKNQIILKRLAQSSVDYYEKTYNAIAVSFTISALYPIVASLLFFYIGNAEVTLDANPFDGYDTALAVINTVDKILLFLVVCFLVLTCVGIIQTFFMVRMHFAARNKTVSAYIAIGMTKSDVKRMVMFELKSLLLRSFVFLIFAAFIINACFAIIIEV